MANEGHCKVITGSANVVTSEGPSREVIRPNLRNLRGIVVSREVKLLSSFRLHAVRDEQMESRFKSFSLCERTLPRKLSYITFFIQKLNPIEYKFD